MAAKSPTFQPPLHRRHCSPCSAQKIYTFTTYQRVQIEKNAKDGMILSQKNLRLEVDTNTNTLKLKASPGKALPMERTIHERMTRSNCTF